MGLKNVILIVFLVVFIASCNQITIEDVLSEEIEYLIYEDSGFSIEYPNWNVSEETNEETEISVSKGFCTVIIDSNDVMAEHLYTYLIDSLIEAPHIVNYEQDDDDYFVKATAMFQEHRLISHIKIAGCNNKAHMINIACLETVIGYPEVMAIYDNVLNSIECEEDEEIAEENYEAMLPVVEEIDYDVFEEEDFEIEYPDWDSFNTEMGEENILAVTKGTCSVIVNKHNYLPSDLASWIKTALEEDEDEILLYSDEENDEFELKYTSPYEDKTMISNANIMYCNYQSYMSVVVCIEDVYEDSLYREFKEEFSEFEEMSSLVMGSVNCKEKYEIPKAEITEELIEEDPEIVEVIEDIETRIVQTDLAEDFGFDAEAIVYFINLNNFFNNVMSDFDKANLVFEDDSGNLELKIDISNDGQIELVDDGLYGNADVTLYVPLKDALNILNNAENINPINLISFAINVRTDPVETKDEVLRKVINGEYN